MKELISYEAVEEIVDKVGYKNSSMDYKKWTEYQFKKFITETLYMVVNTALNEIKTKSSR